MNGWEKAKIVVLIILIFPFILFIGYFGYLTLEFLYNPFHYHVIIPNPAETGFRALIAGCAVGFSLGIIIGYRIGTQEK